MEIKDIKTVLELAKERARDQEPDYEGRHDHYKSIEAVETWLMEIGALPPR